MASQQPWRTESETVRNLTEVGEDEDENMDDDAQESDTACMSTEKQPAPTSAEGAPRGLSPGARQALATQLEKDILAEEIEVAALKRSLHLQKVRAECETLRRELELLGAMEADAVADVADAQAARGDGVEWTVPVRRGQPRTDIVVSTEPAQKRSRGDSDRAHLVALEAKQDVPRPTPYEGKNQRELDDFLLQCRNTFAMRPNTYESDEYWVMWAVTYLRGQVARTRERQANEAGRNPFTWESFQEFLQNKLKPANLR
ncbi:MAG: hypothetical protein M1815_004287 [Lichina confinis]|nr:MAG: hypothetical protein M1815_004287 [Lichina confinis]